MRELQDSPVAQHTLTSDGSSTLFSSVFNQHYHSIHGAIQESMHVFIQSGLQEVPLTKPSIRIFEMGFGTGLNALLTYLNKASLSLHYVAIEAYPIQEEQISVLNYASILSEADVAQLLQDLHDHPWGVAEPIREGFTLEKHLITLQEYSPEEGFDLIYFDAFAPSAQPELWTDEIMARMSNFPSGGWHFCYLLRQKQCPQGIDTGRTTSGEDSRTSGEAGDVAGAEGVGESIFVA